MSTFPFRHIALRQGPRYADLRKMAVRRKTSIGLLNVSEKDFQDHVFTMAALYGWHGKAVRLSKGVMEGLHSPNRGFPRGADHDDASGFPDLFLVHPERRLVILAELKTRRGRTTLDQERWLAWTHDLGSLRSFLWRPENEQEILMTLKEGWKV